MICGPLTRWKFYSIRGDDYLYAGRLGVTLELVRWDRQKPGTCDNLVLMSSNSMKQFEKTGPEGLDATIKRQIERRLGTCRAGAEVY